MMDTERACYVCGAPATSNDHVPPQGFYPKQHELTRGKVTAEIPNYRTNLITVPACDEHNLARSKDDAYAQAIVIILCAALQDATDPEKLSPFVEKWMRLVHRGRRLTTWYGSAERRGDSIQTKVEEAEMRRVFEATARGLYFHHHKHARRWEGECNVQVPAFCTPELGHHPAKNGLQTIMEAFRELRRRKDPLGEVRGPHPDVFYYQLLEVEDVSPVMLMVFYGTFPVIAMGPPRPVPQRFRSSKFQALRFEFAAYVPNVEP